MSIEATVRADALPKDISIAVLLPCYNEEVTIGKCVRDFQRELPGADIYVFDNNSRDRTSEVAREAGAIVVHSPRQGKGYVVQHMMDVVDADVYIMADGDDTYPPEFAPGLIKELLDSSADMVVGTRLTSFKKGSFPALHQFGNKSISGLIATLFKAGVTDVLSGYRVFTRGFVQDVYVKSGGFEIETELTLQALIRNKVIREVPFRYDERPAGSDSKLSTFKDGARIIRAIFMLFKEYKPLVFFTILAGIFFILGLIAGWLPVQDYVQTKFVSHVPLAVLATALEILAVLFLGIGMILNAIVRFRFEQHAIARKLYRYVDRARQT